MYKILVTDDESRIRELIKKYAQYEGYEIAEAVNGFEAVEMSKNEQIDLVIMDIMMPELDGFSAVKEIRKFSEVPVIMLSARGEEYDKIHGFELGIDDYVVKPFSPKELMMRTGAILKRYSRNTDPAKDRDIFEYEDLKVDFTARIVYVADERIELSPKEYDLLFYFINNKNIALSREKLIRDIWGYDFYGDDRTLDTHIKLLRKHLGKYSSLIVTVRGMGYRFETN
ncbi:MAG: response regulator transcription factor [Anaerofustis stercorihominis]|nr:response regulator transcription factor [Anaerofustis stercorihominis]